MTRPFNHAHKATPWGHADQVRIYPGGVVEVSTPSHGGFYLEPPALEKVPAPWVQYGAQWSHGWGAGWFEEDCAALAVFCTFPDLFAGFNDWADIERAARNSLPDGGAAAERVFASMPHRRNVPTNEGATPCHAQS